MRDLECDLLRGCRAESREKASPLFQAWGGLSVRHFVLSHIGGDRLQSLYAMTGVSRHHSLAGAAVDCHFYLHSSVAGRNDRADVAFLPSG